jgi:hypothetical protein
MAKKLTFKQFLEKSKLKHGEKYDYSLVEYKSSNKQVSIICPKHGIFQQKPYDHYNGNVGCPICGKKKLDTKEFIEKSKLKHGEKYDYSLVEYGKNNTKEVKILCTIHGVFHQKPLLHLRGSGCPMCSGNIKKTTEQFIEKSKLKHGEKYDYSLVEYQNKLTVVNIICPKHGIFQQRPNLHLQGFGCKSCNESRLEKKVRDFLESKKVKFISQKKFTDCKNILPLSFDFFLIEKNVLLECNGIQHYEPVEYFGGQERYRKQKLNDDIKKKFCKKNGIQLLIINNLNEVDGLLSTL